MRPRRTCLIFLRGQFIPLLKTSPQVHCFLLYQIIATAGTNVATKQGIVLSVPRTTRQVGGLCVTLREAETELCAYSRCILGRREEGAL